MRYNDKILDHFYRPRHVGAFDVGDVFVHTARVGVAGSGDVLQLQLQICEGRIKAARFLARASVCGIASCSWVADWLVGRSVEEAAELTSATIVAALDLPQSKVHVALLVEDAVKEAIGLS